MAAKTAAGVYYIVNFAAQTVSSGPSYASQTPIANVVGFRVDFKTNPKKMTAVQAQLEVAVYDTTSNAAIAKQGPQVIPNGYTDYKGVMPLKFIRSRSADVICITVDGGPGANQGDFYATDATVPFGQSGDAVLLGTNT